MTLASLCVCTPERTLSRERTLEHDRQLALYRRARNGTDAVFRDHDHVVLEPRSARMAAERFSDPAFQEIAGHRAADLPTDGDPEPRHAGRTPQHEHEVSHPSLFAAAAQGQELPAATNARRLREALAMAGRHLGCFGGIETVSRLRPLARLRLRTFRPPGVAIRVRNPCVFLRRVLLG